MAYRISDILCQVCTGGGVSFRQLYTNEGENIAQFRHAVILSSISLPIVSADLMDRTIILKLQRISDEDRKTEQELWQGFDDAKAAILGGIFDTLANAMQIYPTITLEKTPRLADFAKWGYAVAEALGQSGDQFLDDYSKNVTSQNEGVIENNVLCQAVLTLMADKPIFDKSVADAHRLLKLIAGEDAKDSTFPKLPHNLRGQLDQLRATLLEQGISYQFSERDKAGVRVTFSNLLKSDTPPSQDTSDSFEKTDTSGTSDTPTPDSNPLNIPLQREELMRRSHLGAAFSIFSSDNPDGPAVTFAAGIINWVVVLIDRLAF